ncbi:unnamed protein product [Trichogramma brassicae]|uniref:Uncharacterized protein n=1 Tax=Trichogramma brassicae TaxID=86971 RepID=A0A6H5J0D1_9HYME|nr:unnamed protein product [Trichogramma brassicae]
MFSLLCQPGWPTRCTRYEYIRRRLSPRKSRCFRYFVNPGGLYGALAAKGFVNIYGHTRNIAELREIPRIITEYHGIPRNTTEYHGIMRNTTEYHGNHEISRNSAEYHGIPRNYAEYHGIPRKPRNITEFRGIPRNYAEYAECCGMTQNDV